MFWKPECARVSGIGPGLEVPGKVWRTSGRPGNRGPSEGVRHVFPEPGALHVKVGQIEQARAASTTRLSRARSVARLIATVSLHTAGPRLQEPGGNRIFPQTWADGKVSCQRSAVKPTPTGEGAYHRVASGAFAGSIAGRDAKPFFSSSLDLPHLTPKPANPTLYP